MHTGRARIAPGVAAAAAAWLAGCTGTITDPCDPAATNAAPEAPAILAPGLGAIDAPPDALAIATSAFADADPTDRHAATEIEIWAVEAGEPVARVWHSYQTDPARLTSVTLADGAFDAAVTSLSPARDYAVRARYKDTSGACEPWSDWSPWRRFRTDDGSAYWFDPDRIVDVYIDLSPESWAAIDAEATPPDCVPYERHYYPGTVRVDDQVFDGAGVRAKGGCGSARHLDGKPGWKIHLAWDDPAVPGCPESRRLHGQKRLTLNNMVQDPTFLHERLGYALYRALGLPAPRAQYVRVFVNGEPWGLYLHVESIDRRFLRRRSIQFASHAGMLYEGTYWCDLEPDNVPPSPDEDDGYCFSAKFDDDECSDPPDGGDPLDYTPLAKLVADVQALPEGEFYPAIEAYVDFDRLLRQWAADAIIAHWDSYTYEIQNNYRLYHDPATDRWSIIQTGLDQTFARRDFDPFAVDGLLARRCMQEADCAAAFAATLREAVDVFEQLDLAAVAEQVEAQIDPYVAEDPRKEVDLDTFRSRADRLREWIRARPDAVRGALAARGL
ncbi:MAG: hypothetical protein D6689_19415 [Deltaproteobacteria bacterium]|nr:MAG: hypothetical protein D6689_19415 [Deltaproteobacteria bacterium]